MLHLVQCPISSPASLTIFPPQPRHPLKVARLTTTITTTSTQLVVPLCGKSLSDSSSVTTNPNILDLLDCRFITNGGQELPFKFFKFFDSNTFKTLRYVDDHATNLVLPDCQPTNCSFVRDQHVLFSFQITTDCHCFPHSNGFDFQGHL